MLITGVLVPVATLMGAVPLTLVTLVSLLPGFTQAVPL
jgi:hypothetical protein